MTITEGEIRALWDNDRPVYQKWVEFVKKELCQSIANEIHPRPLSEFAKIPLQHRLKTAESLVEKALFRDKQYAAPYDEITDKAGLRIVVLLTREVKMVASLVERSAKWTAEKSRDFAKEQQENPLVFDYQSLHYVVRCSSNMEFEGVTIPKDLPCEVQLRTLLQHAHSELTHDTIYKAKRERSSRLHRTVAKSMALIEVVDTFFEDVYNEVAEGTMGERTTLKVLSQLYAEVVGASGELQQSSVILLDAYSNVLREGWESRLDELLKVREPYIGKKIAETRNYQTIFAQPAILLAYLAASDSPRVAKHAWPFPPETLRSVYTHLGIAFDQA